jgi:hypothetical protein
VTVLVIGASGPAFQRLRILASGVSASIDLVERRSGTPDWVLAATGDQRAEAIASFGLPPYRVVEMPALLSDEEMARTERAIRSGLQKMAGLGRAGPLTSPSGVSLARLVVRLLHDAAARAARRGDEQAQDFVGTDDVPWPPTAAQWTEGPQAQPERRVSGRIPVGPELDEVLRNAALMRVKRFSTQCVRDNSDR